MKGNINLLIRVLDGKGGYKHLRSISVDADGVHIDRLVRAIEKAILLERLAIKMEGFGKFSDDGQPKKRKVYI
jgi:hypothetical protein